LRFDPAQLRYVSAVAVKETGDGLAFRWPTALGEVILEAGE
jgi:hypothetical protein